MIFTVLICLAIAHLSWGFKNSTNAFVNLVGEGLYKWNKDHTQLEMGFTSDLLKGKTAVGIYFSASWCGPCRQFTPKLVDYYKEVNKKGKKFEVVLVSQDQNPTDFVEYFQKMPWLAIPMDEVVDYVQTLGAQFRLKGIPHLVILDGYDATVYTLDGRGKIMSDKYGLEYPYRPRTVLNAIPRPLKNLLQMIALRAKVGIMTLSVNLSKFAGLGITALQVKARILLQKLLKKMIDYVKSKGV
jgi:thiol-disulfide isomerase/thioredoxin